jgi:hypothetical protein
VRESRTIEGRWWVFGAKRTPHFGVLTFNSESGLNLEVKVPTPPSFRESARSPWRIEMPCAIFGRDKDNKAISLFGCAPPSIKHSGGMVSYTFHPLRAMLGKRFSRWEQIAFDNVQVEYSLLHNWTGRSSLRVDFDTHRASFERIDDRDFSLPSAKKLTLGAFVTTSHDGCTLDVREGHWVEFLLNRPLHVNELFDNFVNPFRRFLTLVTGERVYADSAHFNDGEIELLQTNQGVGGAERKKNHQNMIASLPDLGGNVDAILRRWFDYHEKLEAALNLYFAVVFNRGLYNNHRFLFLAQALEVYHRNNPNFVGHVEPTAKFKRRVRSIIGAAPESDRNWVKEKLCYANEKTLADRLSEILSTAPTEVDRFIPNRGEFAEKVRHTRNYYTHFSRELRLKGKAVADSELTPLTEQMRGLLLLCFLRDLGIGGRPLSRVAHSIQNLRFISL